MQRNYKREEKKMIDVLNVTQFCLARSESKITFQLFQQEVKTKKQLQHTRVIRVIATIHITSDQSQFRNERCKRRISKDG